MKMFISAFLVLVSASAFAKKVPLTSQVFAMVNENEATSKLRLFVSEKVVSKQYSFDKDADIDRGIDFTTDEVYYKEVLKANRRGAFVGFTPDRYREDAAYEVYVSFDKSCTKEKCAYKFTRQGDYKEARYVLTRVPDKKGMRFKGITKGATAYLEFDQGLVRKITKIRKKLGGVD